METLSKDNKESLMLLYLPYSFITNIILNIKFIPLVIRYIWMLALSRRSMNLCQDGAMSLKSLATSCTSGAAA